MSWSENNPNFTGSIEDDVLYEYTIYNHAPKVKPIFPYDGKVVFGDSVSFMVNYMDEDHDLGKDCVLYLDGIEVMREHNTVPGKKWRFDVNLSPGEYDWYVGCSDGALSDVSEIRTVIVEEQRRIHLPGFSLH